MFLNRRKTIGLFISDHFDQTFQSELCRGVVERARALDINVAIFSMYSSYGKIIFDSGEMNIFQLADFSQLSGIIFAFAPGYFTEKELLAIKNICETVTCPAISLNEDLDFIPCVLIDNYHALDDVIEHIINVHGRTRIDYLSGTPGMEAAEDRLRCYREHMQAHGIYDERRIYHGDFWRDTAAASVPYFLGLEEELPDAIICANDHAALVVCRELNNRGIRVPEDVIVTGCDDIQDAATYFPPLTTVRISAYSMGEKGVDNLLTMMSGDEIPHKTFCEHVTIYRDSCGCNSENDDDLRIRRQLMTEELSLKNIASRRVMYLSIDLQSAPTGENLHRQISDFLDYGNHINGFCVCLSTDWKERGQQPESLGFTPQMNMTVGLYDGTRIPAEAFPTKQLLPTILLRDEPLAYFFSSLHYRNCCYGYVAINYEDEFARSEEWRPFLINFTNALEAYRVRDELQRTVDELNTLYIHDSLCGIMNRRGFQLNGEALYQRACKEGLSLFSFSADLDDLKFINDTYGHAQGDIALRRIAEALMAASRNNEPCARVGGDEFSVLGVGYTGKDAERFATRFLNTLERLNKENPQDYPASASWGYVLYPDPTNCSLEDILRATDERMYQMKIDHKNK